MSENPEPIALKKRKVHQTITEAARASTMPEESDSESSKNSAQMLNTSAVSGDGNYDNFLNKKPARVREKRSEVWNYFEVQEVTNNGQTIRIGKCKNCPYYGKYSSSTSFMKDHLRKCKGITYPGGLNGSFTEDADTSLQEAGVKADGDGDLTTPHKVRRLSRASTVHSSTKPRADLNFEGIWEAVNDARRAKYPKALNALLEDLGVFEAGDLKSLDYEQFEILGSLLKPAPLKAYLELVYR